MGLDDGWIGMDGWLDGSMDRWGWMMDGWGWMVGIGWMSGWIDG